MLKEGKIYRLTEEGRKAWESQDTAIPAEYRRILWLIETEAHVALGSDGGRAIRAERVEYHDIVTPGE